MWAHRSDHLFFILKLIKAKIKGNLPSKSLVVIHENVEPEVDKNWNYLLRFQQTFAQDKKYSTFWRNSYPKGWKVSAWARKTRILLLGCLLASCQLRNFLHEFTEKCFAVFHQWDHMVYLMWYTLLLFFWEFTSIIPFKAWL